MMAALSIVIAVLVAWALVLGLHWRRLKADWREPVFAAPVLIIESDDWGPGPPEDGTRLQQLAAVLQAIRDARGQPPVATLGVLLAVPGTALDRHGRGPAHYASRALDETEFEALRDAMLAGRDTGVFALQLHGMEHFWPPALMRAAAGEKSIRAFLAADAGVPRHESLPPHLQARWIDASRLPSAPLDRADIDRAVAEETEAFARIFEQPARVAVPVTFTWTTEVEAAWARHGIRILVTPGTRNVGRDAKGRLIGDGSILRNGDTVAGSLVCVVRDIYFEPANGHSAGQALRETIAHHRLGRPALLETHRFNFTGGTAQAERSLAELQKLLQSALVALPELRFMSTEALAEAMVRRDPALIEARLAARLRCFVQRAATLSRLRKLAWISGLALPAAAAFAIASALLRATAHRGRG